MPPTVLTVISIEEVIERRRVRALLSSIGRAIITLVVNTILVLKLLKLNIEEQLMYLIYVSLYT